VALLLCDAVFLGHFQMKQDQSSSNYGDDRLPFQLISGSKSPKMGNVVRQMFKMGS